MTRSGRAGGGAATIAAGIFLSRILGFVRDAALAFFFGAGPHADVFRTALRGPNILQNMLGEQTLSASFIPIYSRMLHEGREEEAGRFAGAIFGLLLAVAGGLALLGIVLARPIVTLLAPGYLGDAALVAAGEATADRFELAVRAVRIIFPMTAMLVLSAWCLGVLNSHRRFFVPYFAPVLWNLAIVTAMVLVGTGVVAPAGSEGTGRLDALLIAACVGALVGGFLQFAVQLPMVARQLRHFKISWSLRVEGVRQSLTSLAPVLAARGIVQISAYVDLVLASLLAAGAVASLGWAQTLYLLPISLFGMSVAAAELPELARRAGDTDRDRFAERVSPALRRMAFLTVPTTVGYLALGFLLVGGLFRRGSFGLADNWLVYLVLCGYTIGLLASTSSRLLVNVYYALSETKIPAAVAVARVVVSIALGIGLMLQLDRFPISIVAPAEVESDLRLGAVGLALAAGVAAWVELVLLRRRLGGLLPQLRWPWAALSRYALVAVVSVVPAALLWRFLPSLPLLLEAVIVVGLYGLTYLLSSYLLGWPEARDWVRRLLERRSG